MYHKLSLKLLAVLFLSNTRVIVANALSKEIVRPINTIPQKVLLTLDDNSDSESELDVNDARAQVAKNRSADSRWWALAKLTLFVVYALNYKPIYRLKGVESIHATGVKFLAITSNASRQKAPIDFYELTRLLNKTHLANKLMSKSTLAQLAKDLTSVISLNDLDELYAVSKSRLTRINRNITGTRFPHPFMLTPT